MKRNSSTDAPLKRENVEGEAQQKSSPLLTFEDPFIDEYEEEEIVDGEKENEDDKEEMEMEDDEEKENVFKIGKDKLEEGETLDYDNSAYRMYHRLNVDWPCLSFDIVADNLGIQRTNYPHMFYAVSGTQAENTIDNQIVVCKMFNLCKTQYDDDPEEMEPEDYGEDPKLVYDTISHHGCINRIRCMPDRPQIVSVWSDQRVVSIYNVSTQLAALEAGRSAGDNAKNTLPIFQFKGHSDEGYAMDWCRCEKGKLATGDCKGEIYVYHPTESSWKVDLASYVSHEGSVEDIQWSPSEATVFASCSVDRTIKIWDTRNRNHHAMLSVQAHSSDVNVLSWNREVGYLMVSGSDDGSFRIWDIRNFTDNNAVGDFNYLNAPITSVEWSPHDSSVLSVSSDQQLTVWDLSLEADSAVGDADIPPQLLFVHAGQNSIKELHYHPQIPNMIVSTAYDGFNCFIPDICVGEEIDEE